MLTRLALELTTRLDFVSLDTATARAIGRTIRVSPTHGTERLISLVLAHCENSLEAQGAGGG